MTTTIAMSMPFLDHLVEATTHRSSKKQKRSHSFQSSSHISTMSYYGSPSGQFLNPPLAPSRKKSQRFIPTDVDEFLSSDLEVSFASNVSLNSPPREHLSLAASDCEPMDISPAPAPKPVSSRLTPGGQRPRAFTSGARLFGSDLSNNRNPLLPSPHLAEEIKAKPTDPKSGTKKIQRSALPFEWLAPARGPEPPTAEVSIFSFL